MEDLIRQSTTCISYIKALELRFLGVAFVWLFGEGFCISLSLFREIFCNRVLDFYLLVIRPKFQWGKFGEGKIFVVTKGEWLCVKRERELFILVNRKDYSGLISRARGSPRT